MKPPGSIWEGNPFLSSLARRKEEEHKAAKKDAEIEALQKRIDRLESIDGR